LIALLEPCPWDDLVDRPHLGCAMLTSALYDHGIDTVLISGQSRVIPDLFLSDADELFSLLRHLKKDEEATCGLTAFKNAAMDMGQRAFCHELAALYHYLFDEDNKARRSFDGATVRTLISVLKAAAKVYSHYLRSSKISDLRVVNRYLDRILASHPKVIGISLPYRMDPIIRSVIRQLRANCNSPIVFGGSLLSHLRPADYKEFLQQEEPDYMIVGEGEFAFPALVQALLAGEDPLRIPNVIYLDANHVAGSRESLTHKFDELPYPDYSQFPLDWYFPAKRVLPLQSSRGCSWRKCVFCSHHKTYSGYRKMDADCFASLVEHLAHTYNCRHFVMHDEDLPAARAKALSRALIECGPRECHFYAMARPTSGYDNDDTFQLLKKAGFRTIAWGVESASKSVLREMKKGTRPETACSVLIKCKKSGIGTICFLIIGFPSETDADRVQTIKFLENNSQYIDIVIANKFEYSPGSPLAEDRSPVEITDTERVNNDIDDLLNTLVAGELRVTSGVIDCMAGSGNLARLQLFMLYSHGLLRFDPEKQRIPPNSYPMVLGRASTARDGLPSVRLYRSDHTPAQDKACEKQGTACNETNEALTSVYLLADGSYTISQIARCLPDSINGPVAISLETCRVGKIIQKSVQEKTAMIFEKPWAKAARRTSKEYKS